MPVGSRQPARTTTSGRYIAELDGLRAVALTMVLLFHAEVILNVVSGFSRIAAPFGPVRRVPGRLPPVDGLSRVLLQGYFGIYLFFILSGFILAIPFLEHRLEGGPSVDLRRFYLRRLTRLQAPYSAALTVFLVAGSAVGGVGAITLLRHYGTSLVYLHGALLGGVTPINGPLWTMEVEIQFYVVLPLLAMVFLIPVHQLRRLAIVLIAALAILWQVAFPAKGSFFFVSIGFFLQFFLAGFLLADVYVSRWRRRRRSVPWDLVTVGGWPVFIWLAIRGTKAWDQSLLPWVALPLFGAALRGTYTGRLLGNRWVAGFGAASFSIYLVHYPLLVLMARAVRPVLTGSHHVDWLIVLGAGLPVVLAARSLLFRFVERPCLDPLWPAKLLARLRGVRSVT